MPKLLVSSDWQLGKGGRLADQRDVVMRIADVAIDEGVDGVLLGGDLLEGPQMQPEQLDVITTFLDRLQGRIPCLGITGNSRHDLAMRESHGLQVLNHIDGIDIHSSPAVVEFAGVAVGLLPWVHPGRLIAQQGGGTSRDAINAEAADLLTVITQTLYADAASTGLPTLLLGHWHTDLALDANGNGIAQFLHEPVLAFYDLADMGWGMIALAHNHRAQELGGNGFHIGSPMPHDFGEAGWEHGVWVVDLDGDSERRFVPIESRPFVTLDFDVVETDVALIDVFEVAAAVDLDGAIVRLRYRATAEQDRRIDIPLLRRELLDAGAAVVRVQPDIVRPDRARVQGLDETVDELQGLDLYIEANGIDAGLAGLMRDRTRHYLDTAAA